MTVEDCYELGKIAYSDVDYYHTELWMAQALKQLDEGEESTIDKVTVLDYLSYSIYQQGEIERALEYTMRLLELGELPPAVCDENKLRNLIHHTFWVYFRCLSN